jgi:hypothetical protein
MMVSERAQRPDEDCTAAWRRRAGQGECDIGRGGKSGEGVIYVERDLYLRSLVIFWASNENG